MFSEKFRELFPREQSFEQHTDNYSITIIEPYVHSPLAAIGER